MATFTGTDADEIITPEFVSPTVTASGASAPSGEADTIYGGNGNDTVAGGGGNDTIYLGGGDDRFIWNPGDGRDTVYGGTGFDTLEMNGSSGDDAVEFAAHGSSVHVLMPASSNPVILNLAGMERIEFLASWGTDSVTVGDLTGTSAQQVAVDLAARAGQNAGDNRTDTVTVRGSAAGDTIQVDGDANLVTIRGLAAEITIANSDGLGDRLIIDGGGGVDSIDATKLAPGAVAITLRGGAGDDYLFGGAGDDILEGGTGADFMKGGAGIDWASYANAASGVIVSLRLGRGTGGEADGDYLVEIENLIGSAFNDTLIGDNGDNIFRPGRGADVIYGEGGSDTVDYSDAPWFMRVDLGEGYGRLHGHEDEDDLLFGIENIIGSIYQDSLIGNGRNNILEGMAGGDRLNGGGGIDTASYSRSGSSVTVDLGEPSNTRGGHAEGDTLISIENLIGSAHHDVLSGDDGDNVLDGGAGADKLTGRGGNDTLIGGRGNDTYFVMTAGDTVVEKAGEGNDTVVSLIDYTLTAHVENLELNGERALKGTGNGLDNTIKGNRFDNILDGRGGNDVLIGGTGDDTYVVDRAGDTVVEKAGEGHDTVRSSASYTLSNHVEDLVLTGNKAIDATGNGLDNRLVGNKADNLLDGKGGADTMIGGEGNDTYIVDHAGDIVSEKAGGGIDTVRSSISYVLGAELEKLVLTGSMAISGTGNAAANQMTGNAASNVIDGGGGNDTLEGKGGNDHLIGGAGRDVLSGGLGRDVLVGGKGKDSFLFGEALGRAHVDRIEDFRPGKDKILLDSSMLGGIVEGKLGKKAFVEGNAAKDGKDRVIYNEAKGKLSFDADGKGGAKAVLFARVDKGLELSHSDFLIV